MKFIDKFADDKTDDGIVGRYFIAADVGPKSWSHMTIKFLGNLTQKELDDAKKQMDQVAGQATKFEVRSEGYGLLGRSKSNLVDFVEPTDRVTKVFDKLKNKSGVPHITRKYGKPGKHGPYEEIDEELVEKIHLYRSDGFQDWKKVYTVTLQRRSPVQWIKDQFNW